MLVKNQRSEFPEKFWGGFFGLKTLAPVVWSQFGFLKVF